MSLLIFSCFQKSGKSKNLPDSVSKKIEKSTGISKNPPYHFILPKDTSSASFQLLVVIDPHGEGKKAADRFSFVAQKYPCLVIGLDEVQNNTPNFETLISKAVSDVSKRFRYKIEKTFFVGFSGGARMAFQYSGDHQISGLIMCGAGPGQLSENLNFPLVLIAGMKDFNFGEQFYDSNSALMKNKMLVALPFEGKHEWPEEKILSAAIDFIFKKSGISPKTDKSLNLKALSKQYEEKGQYFLSFKMLETYAKSADEEHRKEADSLLRNLITSKFFISYMQYFEKSLAEEQNRNQKYMQAIDDKDFRWWKMEIGGLNTGSEDRGNSLTANTCARNKAFLGILMYSKLNALFNSQDTTNLDKYLKIYERLEPKNPDMFYFKARQSYLKNENEKCKNLLKQAKERGLADSAKINSVFPKNFVN
jgi:hypothetical protein